jgi:thimet oligopeptidase
VKIGRFYLDLLPRDHKYKHAAMFTIRTPKKLPGDVEQTPIAALVCNFPAPEQPMPHDQVVTYFHEFGHVLHHILTKTELASFAGTNTVRDFVETPSQMFEEWAWSRDVLDLFAQHRDTNAKLPEALFKAMIDARRVGLATATERQLYLAHLDLAYHTTPPGFDTTELLQKIHGQYFSFEYVPGTHFQSSFGHLIGYDAGYYGYQWALALAHDVLGQFKQKGLFDTAVAQRWRDEVLSKGGSRDPREMLTTFLGRAPSERAYAKFLEGPAPTRAGGEGDAM